MSSLQQALARTVTLPTQAGMDIENLAENAVKAAVLRVTGVPITSDTASRVVKGFTKVARSYRKRKFDRVASKMMRFGDTPGRQNAKRQNMR